MKLRWPLVCVPTHHPHVSKCVRSEAETEDNHYNAKHHIWLERSNYVIGPYMLCSPQTVNTNSYVMIPAVKNYSCYSYVTLIREGE
jgi:hypothetical protein